MAQTPVPVFAPGQMWSVQSDVGSTIKIIVGRVEPFGLRTAIHVSVIDIPDQGAGGPNGIAHMPFDETALSASVAKLMDTDAVPSINFERGYQNWQRDEGGVFSISVVEAVGLILQTLTAR